MQKKYELRVGGLIKTSLIDFPGKVSAVVFFQGCNFRCPYCYNVDLVLPDKFSRPMDIESILSFLEKRKKFLDGVVLLGGEPTLQKDLIPFAEHLKDLGYLIKLDTNGSHPEVIKEMIKKGIVDYIAMDVKAPLSYEEYHQVTNLSKDAFDGVLKSIKLIKNSSIDYEFRTTFVRGLIPLETAEIIAAQLSPAKRYVLQNFYPSAESYVGKNFQPTQPYAPWELEKMKKRIEENFEIQDVLVRA